MAIRGTASLRERLAIVIKRMSRSMGGFPQLAQELATTVNKKANLQPLPWRRLQKIASRESVRLSFSELEALHAALSHHGYTEGLAGLFSPPRLMELLAARGSIVLVVGTKPYLLGSMVPITSTSHWDLRSVAELTAGIYGQAPPSIVSVIIDEVPLRSLDHSKSLTGSDVPMVDPDELYPTLLEREELKLIGDTRSVICIGSPRANHAAEYMLAKMFNVPPFLTQENASSLRLPFRFEWSATQLRELRSTFACERLNTEDGYDEHDWRTSALCIGHERLNISRGDKSWIDYGVIAVQRRPSGGVWACCAGSGGPGTYAAACVLTKMMGHLPTPTNKRQVPRVLWAVARARVECMPDVLGDNRRAVSQGLLFEPRLWPDDGPQLAVGN